MQMSLVLVRTDRLGEGCTSGAAPCPCGEPAQHQVASCYSTFSPTPVFWVWEYGWGSTLQTSCSVSLEAMLIWYYTTKEILENVSGSAKWMQHTSTQRCGQLWFQARERSSLRLTCSPMSCYEKFKWPSKLGLKAIYMLGLHCSYIVIPHLFKVTLFLSAKQIYGEKWP